MPIDTQLLLYSLANTFKTTLGTEVCNETVLFMKTVAKTFAKLDIEEKMFYTKYSMQLTTKLSFYLQEITRFELNTDTSPEINHDFRLIWKNDSIAHLSMVYNSINVKDIIPEKLMRICKYKRNTNICKKYMEEYQKINDEGYDVIQKYEKYTEIPENIKNKILLEPVCNLVMNTIAKKRKCANNLYNHLLNETDRIVLKLYKNRFTIYDFGVKTDTDVTSFRMALETDNTIVITFNNKAEFILRLHTNASEIKNHLSLKFHTHFNNLDELFAIDNTTV